MNKLSKEEQVRVVACLVEGNSLRATSRMTGTHRQAIQKLLVELGAACFASDFSNSARSGSDLFAMRQYRSADFLRAAQSGFIRVQALFQHSAKV